MTDWQLLIGSVHDVIRMPGRETQTKIWAASKAKQTMENGPDRIVNKHV